MRVREAQRARYRERDGECERERRVEKRIGGGGGGGGGREWGRQFMGKREKEKVERKKNGRHRQARKESGDNKRNNDWQL